MKNRLEELQGFDIGEAFVKKGNLEIVMVKVPFADIKGKVMFDEELKNIMNDIYQGLMDKVQHSNVSDDLKVDEKKEEDGREKLLMNTVYLNYKSPITKIYEMSGLANSTGNKIKEALKKKGLVGEFETIIKNKKGGSAKFMYLTDMGYELLGLSPRVRTRGNPEHTFGCRLASDFYEGQGYETKIEDYVEETNGCVDVTASKENYRIAIEVCLSIENIRRNVEKSWDYFNEIILVFRNEKDKKRAVKIIKDFLPEESKDRKIDFKYLYDYYL